MPKPVKRKKPRKKKPTCIACGDTGQASKGGRCCACSRKTEGKLPDPRSLSCVVCGWKGLGK